MVPLLWRELKPSSSRVSLVVAMALDFLSGLHRDHPLNLLHWLKYHFIHDYDTVIPFAQSLEEFLEVAAVTLLWAVFVKHFTRIAQWTPVVFFFFVPTVPALRGPGRWLLSWAQPCDQRRDFSCIFCCLDSFGSLDHGRWITIDLPGQSM